MIFDEIDAGISGITASVVGRKLKEIAENHQIICITHLPQIAACGSASYRIYKETDLDKTYTHVERLTDAQTVDEIARLSRRETTSQRQPAKARQREQPEHDVLADSLLYLYDVFMLYGRIVCQVGTFIRQPVSPAAAPKVPLVYVSWSTFSLRSCRDLGFRQLRHRLLIAPHDVVVGFRPPPRTDRKRCPYTAAGLCLRGDKILHSDILLWQIIARRQSRFKEDHRPHAVRDDLTVQYHLYCRGRNRVGYTVSRWTLFSSSYQWSAFHTRRHSPFRAALSGSGSSIPKRRFQ